MIDPRYMYVRVVVYVSIFAILGECKCEVSCFYYNFIFIMHVLVDKPILPDPTASTAYQTTHLQSYHMQ